MSWKPLDQIYLEKTAGQLVPILSRQDVLKENVSVYVKRGESDSEHIGNVSDEYYDSTLKGHIELGSEDNIEMRNIIEDRLEACNGNIDNNADIWQSYMIEGKFDMSDTNFKSSELALLTLISNNGTFILEDFIKSNWPDSDVTNKYFKSAFLSVPKTPVFGRAGISELYLAYFCNGLKPDKGDLNVNGVNIEIKGPGGRLFKTKKIVDNFEPLQRELETVDQIFESVAEFICGISGTSNIKNLVLELVKQFPDQVVQEYNYFKQRNKLRPGNKFTYIGGLAQLFEYKKAQGFDVFLSFTVQKSNKILFKSLDMRSIKSLVQLHEQIDKDVIFKFGITRDGGGWALSSTKLK